MHRDSHESCIWGATQEQMNGDRVVHGPELNSSTDALLLDVARQESSVSGISH